MGDGSELGEVVTIPPAVPVLVERPNVQPASNGAAAVPRIPPPYNDDPTVRQRPAALACDTTTNASSASPPHTFKPLRETRSIDFSWYSFRVRSLVPEIRRILRAARSARRMNHHLSSVKEPRVE